MALAAGEVCPLHFGLWSGLNPVGQGLVRGIDQERVVVAQNGVLPTPCLFRFRNDYCSG